MDEVEELKRALLKTAIRFHSLACFHNHKEHNDGFRQCNSSVCRSVRQKLGSEYITKEYEEFDAMTPAEIDK